MSVIAKLKEATKVILVALCGPLILTGLFALTVIGSMVFVGCLKWVFTGHFS